MNKSFCVGLKPKIGYIYIWLSLSNRLIYVGETCSAHGVVGRARQHVSEVGTLNSKLSDNGYEMGKIEDFYLFSFELPNTWEYTNEETTYRCAVEYLVQIECQTRFQLEIGIDFYLVSHVDYNQKCSTPQNKLIAQHIIAELIDNIRVIQNN